jgi:glycosyltransferase involved in cell wall biosynthesis
MAPDLPELRILLEDLKDNITYIPFDFSGMRSMVLLAKTILFGKFDLIHSHGFTAGIYSTLPACFIKIKHIMTSHDILLSKQFTGLKGILKKKAIAFLLPTIDVIHSVSHDAHNNLLREMPNLKKRVNNCIVIPNGIEVERFKETKKRNFRKELCLPEDTFLIGFFGRFMSPKGFVYLIKSMELLRKDSDLPKKPVVLSFGYGGFIREDMEYINKMGLGEYFHFLDFTPNIAPSLKGLDVVIMPSLWEACGLLAMEAMVAGVPVIGTDCIGLREVLKNTPNNVVPAGNSFALAKAIKHEIRNPSISKAEKFKEVAAKHFDIKKQATKFEIIIENLMNN